MADGLYQVLRYNDKLDSDLTVISPLCPRTIAAEPKDHPLPITRHVPDTGGSGLSHGVQTSPW